jgi:hypothetical protein
MSEPTTEPEGFGFGDREGGRFAAVVYWRRHLIALAGRRAVLELTDRPEPTATLTQRARRHPWHGARFPIRTGNVVPRTPPKAAPHTRLVEPPLS